jgi:hypothetical protein
LKSRGTEILEKRKVKTAMFPIAPLENDDWQFRMDFNFGSSPNVNPHGVIYADDGCYWFALQPLTNAAPLVKSSWPMWRANPQHSGRVQKLD